MKSIEDVKSLVDNPMRLLTDAITVLEQPPINKGDREVIEMLRRARAAIMVRPSDPLVWSIIRCTLSESSVEELTEAAAEARAANRSVA